MIQGLNDVCYMLARADVPRTLQPSSHEAILVSLVRSLVYAERQPW